MDELKRAQNTANDMHFDSLSASVSVDETGASSPQKTGREFHANTRMPITRLRAHLRGLNSGHKDPIVLVIGS